jgi:FtsH-binding integral membrane protein
MSILMWPICLLLIVGLVLLAFNNKEWNAQIIILIFLVGMAFIGFALVGGCSVYSDGRVSSAFDQTAIKAELMRAEKEYGNK